MSAHENPSAFPNTGNSTWNLRPEEGMTLRDWFAGQALSWPSNGSICPEDAATFAYDYADAMLAARKALSLHDREG